MADPRQFQTSTQATDPRVKARRATTAKGTVSKSRAQRPRLSGKTHAPVNQPQLVYGDGPFDLPSLDYDFRLTAMRDETKEVVEIDLIQSINWDDSSALMTGSISFLEPKWAQKLGVADGNQITCEYAEKGSTTWQPVWTMRLYSPGKDYGADSRTFELANELQRLSDSTDTFQFTKSKARPLGWRTDQILKFVLDGYGVPIAPSGIPKMTAYVKNWNPIDQAPLDVIHSALLREKNVTGVKYAFRLDAQGRALVTSYTRPRQLYQIGAQLYSAVYSVARNARFATAVSIHADPTTKTSKDKKGHAKTKATKILVAIQSPGGVKKWGYVHRNLYSPDADTTTEAGNEAKLFLASVARGDRQIQITMQGVPFLRRLDAVRFSLPSEGLKQVVYVTDVSHAVSGASFVTSAVWSFEDPYVDRKEDLIAAKLTDSAIEKVGSTAIAPATPKTTVAATPVNKRSGVTAFQTTTSATKTGGKK